MPHLPGVYLNFFCCDVGHLIKAPYWIHWYAAALSYRYISRDMVRLIVDGFVIHLSL